MSQNSNEVSSDGTAYIKEKYIIPFEKVKAAEGENTNSSSTEGIQESNKAQNKKLRGKNSHRPKLKREPASKKLCRNYWCLQPNEVPGPDTCSSPNCQFSHDIKGFLDAKPEDIGEICHNFSTFGFCPYGVVCRFGSSHIDSGGSFKNEEQYSKYKNNPSVFNTLKKEVQQSLRKRTYHFSSDHGSKNGTENSTVTMKNSLTDTATPSDSSCVDDGTSNVNVCSLSKVSASLENDKPIGPVSDEDLIPLKPREKRKVNWTDKLYLAPLTTLGNLPFRRVCKRLGADITCSEMAVASSLLQGAPSEWALVRRHKSEDCFGVQLCGNNPNLLTKCAELLENEVKMDFVDLNMGCPIDLIFKQGSGSALMRRANRVADIVSGMSSVLSCPVTLKMRTGVYRDAPIAHSFMEKAKLWDVNLITLHGRSKEQRYLKSADWDYIKRCASIADPIPLFGNGDVLTYDDYEKCKNEYNVAGIMVARGALIKPWLFTEIKERRHWDITSSERLEILKEFVNYGLEHWGSDSEGVEKIRRFLLEWLSFLYRYIPVGILERPQKINQRPPVYVGRDHLETLMASKNVKDWIKISEMLLGPVPSDFEFLPKHKANSWG